MEERIRVKLFANLEREFSVPASTELGTPRVIREIIRDIGISDEQVTIIFVDSLHADLDDVVHPGQVLALFPPIGGG